MAQQRDNGSTLVDAGTQDVGVFADARIWWQRGSKTMQIVAKVLDYAEGVDIDWGDRKTSKVGAGRIADHVYAKPGAYFVQATALGTDTVVATAQIVMRDPAKPLLEWAANAENPDFYQATFLDDGLGVLPQFKFDWKDGSDNPIQTVWGVPGQVVMRSLAAGEHDVVVQELTSHDRKVESHTVVGRKFDPDWTMTGPTAEKEVTVKLTVVTAKPIKVDFGDDSAPIDVAAPTVGQEFKHTFDAAQSPSNDGIFQISVYYADGTGDGKTDTVVIPA